MAGLNKLSAARVRGNLAPGRHSDGGGLYLSATPTGGRSWVFMHSYTAANGKRKRREVGLGSLKAVSLAEARTIARKCREAVAQGDDPRTVLKTQERTTFLEAAEACMAARGVHGLHKANVRQWERLVRELSRGLHSRDVATVARADVLDVLTPIWTDTPETGRKARARLETILDYAKGRGWRDGENPARWKGNLDTVLSAHNRRAVRHHPAMPFDEVPEFMARLRERTAHSARALELLILTAARTSEVLQAELSEFDLAAAKWNRPAHRMKNKRAHTVPLSARALEIVREAMMDGGPFLFAGKRPGRPLSNMSMAMLLRRMGVPNTHAVPHGFRSTFRDWMGERTTFAREVAEHALAHSVGNATERAYRRGQALERRRAAMDAWGAFCEGHDLGNSIVRLHAS